MSVDHVFTGVPGGVAGALPTMLAMDGNKDFRDEKEAFGDAVTAGGGDAGMRLRLLPGTRRATSALAQAQARESLTGRGRSRAGLFKKLIEH